MGEGTVGGPIAGMRAGHPRKTSSPIPMAVFEKARPVSPGTTACYCHSMVPSVACVVVLFQGYGVSINDNNMMHLYRDVGA